MKSIAWLLTVFILEICACQTKEPASQAMIKNRDYDKGMSFLYRQNDSAYYYFNRIVTTSKDSLLIAIAYNNMAIIQSDAGDYFGSQETLTHSLSYLDPRKESDLTCLASNYNELGMTSLNLKHYSAALEFYELAFNTSKHKAFRLTILNNKALVYQKQGSYDQALKLYRAILPQTANDKAVHARILSNMAKTQWLAEPGYQAAPALLKALHLRQQEHDQWGENASYAHLADYYTRSQPDSALIFASLRYAVAQRLNSADDRVEALQKLIKLSPPSKTLQYFNSYEHLNDSLQTVRNAAKNQYALIRYDALKNKADNFRLQKNNAEKEYQLSRQRFLLWGGLLLVISGLAVATVWYRKRKLRMAWETQSAIQEHKLQTSKRVHDVVANGLYRLMTEIENQTAIQKDVLLDNIEVLYEQSRNISYGQEPSPVDDYQGKIAKLLASFATDRVKILLVGNNSELWEQVSDQVKAELLPILQELLVNMRKHSRAEAVTIRFELSEGQVLVSYTDDGVGLPDNFNLGNGLRNTGNRINRFSGTLNFDSNTARGLHVNMRIPVA